MDSTGHARNSSRNRTQSEVSFTIGDSSDCESVSTTTTASSSNQNLLSPKASISNTLKNSSLEEYDKLNTELNEHNPWHKYHFHYDKDNNDSASSYKVSREIGGKKNLNSSILDKSVKRVTKDDEISPSTNETTKMIPDSEGDFSIGRIGDIMEGEGSGSNNRDKISKDRGKWRILVGCGIVQLFSALNVSLQAPFYPAEAEKKGATEYCFVFGVYELVLFIFLPLFGSRIHKWRPKLVFNIGILTTAIASIVFGVLDKVNGRVYFIISCVLARALEGLGESALVTASFIIVASAYSDSIAPTFAILETFYGIGLISGPLIGSLLYELGGYSLPFLVLGGALLASAILNFFVLPPSKEISNFQSEESIVISSYRSFKLLGSLATSISAFSIFIGALSISYLQATMEPYLRQFSISQLTTGAIFIINGAMYTIASPFLGILCDKILQLKLVSFCGNALLLIGFSLIGPLPIFQFEPKIWSICLGLALQGFGLGAIFVSSFVSILRNVILKGLPDTPSTYASVSTLITSLFSLGSFMGAVLSGILYNAVGFPLGTSSVIGLIILMMLVIIMFICTSESEMNSFVQSESEPLINNSLIPSSSIYSDDQEACTSKTAISRWNRERSSRSKYGST